MGWAHLAATAVAAPTLPALAQPTRGEAPDLTALPRGPRSRLLALTPLTGVGGGGRDGAAPQTGAAR